MTDDYRLSRPIKDSISSLMHWVTTEGVPDPGDSRPGLKGMSPDFRRLYHAIYLYEREVAEVQARRQAIARPVDAASAQQPVRESARTDKPTDDSPPAPDPMDNQTVGTPSLLSAPPGATKYLPTREFTDPPVPPEAPMKANPPSRPATAGIPSTSSPAKSEGASAPVAPSSPEQALEQAQKPDAEALPPPSTPKTDGDPVYNEPAPQGSGRAPEQASSGAPTTSSAPQPGGVPAFPGGTAVPASPAPKPIETIRKTVYLKNARANEPYEASVEIEGFKGLRMESAGGSGLTIDETSGRLTGTPTASGDFVLRLQGLLHGKRCEVVANLAVIPDPKSLWISKDSDRNAPFWKPDEASEKVEGDLLCVAASKRGRSHAKDGTFRDDDFGLLVTGAGGWHIAVVADGAGSAKYSRRGSKVAVESVLRSLPRMLDEAVSPHLSQQIALHMDGNAEAEEQIKIQLYKSLVSSAFEAAKAIEDEAAAMDEKASAFSTTLIIGVVRRVPQGWFIAGFAIGDGGAAVFDMRDGSLKTLTLPDSGEFAGQTRFLQRSEFSGGFEEITKRIFFDIRQDFTAIALMTDGISDPKFPTDSVFADPAKWMEFWTNDLAKAVDFSRANGEMEQQFLQWLDFWSPGNHDDRTLAILVP